jgi:hypothetical protein
MDALDAGEQRMTVNMDELERELIVPTRTGEAGKDPIGDIAVIVRALTYGEMEQLATELVADDGLKGPDAFAVMKRLHEWQKGRASPPR